MSDPAPVPPLLVSADPHLLEALDRLAAAAGTRTETATDPAAALGRWRDAPLVLVGADRVGALADLRPARRDGVYVVGRRPSSRDLFRHALGVGAEAVVDLPEGDSWLVRALTDAEEGGGRSPAPVVGVVGGSGGVGASTLAAAVAVAATDRRRPVAQEGHLPVCLVDADPRGGGIERILGLGPGSGIHWARLAETSGRLGAGALGKALPRAGGVGVLGWGPGRRGDVDAEVAREVVNAGRRASGLVVLDLPRYPDALAGELLLRCDDLVVVAGSSVPAVAACAQVLDALDPGPRRHLVVRGHGAALAAEDVAGALGLPLCAVLGSQRRLEETVGVEGGPLRSRRGTLARAARAVLAATVTVRGTGGGR